jgi:four helix bundle protein
MAYGQYRKDFLIERSYKMALKIAGVYTVLTVEKDEFILSKQLLKSCTSVGIEIAFAGKAATESEFVTRLSDALKAIDNADLILHQLRDGGYLPPDQVESLLGECGELRSLLGSAINEAGRRAA